MKHFTEAELAALIKATVDAERAECVAVCEAVMDRSNGRRSDYWGAWKCARAIRGRSRIDDTVSNRDTAQHETPKPN